MTLCPFSKLLFLKNGIKCGNSSSPLSFAVVCHENLFLFTDHWSNRIYKWVSKDCWHYQILSVYGHKHTHTHTHYRWPWDSEMQKLHKKDALCWKQFCNQISSMIPLFHPVTPMTALMLMKRETAVIRNKSSRIYSFRKISWQISAADPGPWGRNCGHWGKEGPTQHSLIRVLIQELWPSCISLREVPKMLDGTI